MLKDNKRIDILKETFNSFKEKNSHIFFEGQIYDAYSLLLDIFNKAKEEIIIIDNYINKDILDVISKINIRVLVISKNMNEQLIKKYKSQYCNLEILYKDIFHDRFIIIDKKILYTCGASFKDLGNKCFAINKIDDIEYLNLIIKKIN